MPISDRFWLLLFPYATVFGKQAAKMLNSSALFARHY